MSGRYFDQFQPGDVFRHAVRRTVTEADNVLTCALTMNPGSLHLDSHASAQGDFERVVVNSIYTLGLLVGLSVSDTTLGTGAGVLGYEQVRFPAPVFVGDTLHAVTEVKSLRISGSRPEQGIVAFRHLAFNQKDELVCDCVRQTLVWKSPELREQMKA